MNSIINSHEGNNYNMKKEKFYNDVNTERTTHKITQRDIYQK